MSEENEKMRLAGHPIPTMNCDQSGQLSELADTVCSAFSFGDEVTWNLYESHGTGPDTGIVFAQPHYSDNDVLMVADENAIGMPIAADHCQRTGRNFMGKASEYLKRWDSKMDRDFLK